MKLYLSICMISAAGAFAPPKAPFVRPSSAMFSTDVSDAIAVAKAASKEHGATSVEARIAWELVEELDAANSHEKQSEQEKERQAQIEKLENMVRSVKVPQAPILHVDTTEAVKNALEAAKIYGKTSPEAKMAWDIVEELDAANSHHRAEDIHVQTKVSSEAPKSPKPAVEKKQAVPKTIEEAIGAAMLSSNIYGHHAVETRMAWELVEELDAALSHKKDEVKAAEKPVVVEDPKKPVERKSVHKDTSDAIKAALEASKIYGKTSVEARMAWETVEEIDATNAHHKTVGSG